MSLRADWENSWSSQLPLRPCKRPSSWYEVRLCFLGKYTHSNAFFFCWPKTQSAKLKQAPSSGPHVKLNGGTWVIQSCLPDLSPKQTTAWPHVWSRSSPPEYKLAVAQIWGICGSFYSLLLCDYCMLSMWLRSGKQEWTSPKCTIPDECVWWRFDLGSNNFAILEVHTESLFSTLESLIKALNGRKR